MRAASPTRRGRAAVALLLGALGLIGAVAAPATGDVRRLEAVGAVPIDPDAPLRTSLRDAAIQRALREAVSRVASELLLEAESTVEGPPGDESGEGPAVDQALLDDVLGTEMVRYTSSFRIVEDRGEAPALFSEDPGVTTEYVVIVDVQVEAEPVRQRLIERGLLVVAGPAGSGGRRLGIEVHGLTLYPGYLAFRDLLRAEAGRPEAVETELFEPGRIRFAVAVDTEPAELMARLIRRGAPDLEIAPLGRSDAAPETEPEVAAIRLAVEWVPPTEGEAVGDGAWEGRGARPARPGSVPRGR